MSTVEEETAKVIMYPNPTSHSEIDDHIHKQYIISHESYEPGEYFRPWAVRGMETKVILVKASNENTMARISYHPSLKLYLITMTTPEDVQKKCCTGQKSISSKETVLW
jgi:hypothetical protein